jgi:cell division protein FtsW (lipid II flippase)
MSATTISPSQAPGRRNTELLLLGLALGALMLAYANVGLAENGTLPTAMLTYTLGFGALILVAHLAVRRFAPYADPLLLPAAVMLNGLGLILIHRLDLDTRSKAAPSQLIWTALAVGLFIGVLVVVRDHRRLQRYTYTAMAIGLVFLAIPIFFPAVNGAHIVIRIGGFSIQPAEFSKLLLVLFFAGYLVVKRDALTVAGKKVMGLQLPRGRDLGPLVTVWALFMIVLALEKDFGPALLFFGTFVVMLYIATDRLSWVLIGLLMSAIGAAGAYLVVGSYLRDRVTAWLDPMSDPTGTTRQVLQSLIGFAHGGVLGTGLNQGYPNEVGFAIKSDFILVAVGEELGLAGIMALFMLYILVVMRGLRAALAVRDPFGKLLAGGLAVGIALQVFVVAGGVTKLIPLTGLTMPFLAQGGSSLVANWMLIALLIRISDSARRPAPATPAPDHEATQVVRL